MTSNPLMIDFTENIPEEKRLARYVVINYNRIPTYGKPFILLHLKCRNIIFELYIVPSVCIILLCK